MFAVECIFGFEAAHRLLNHPGKCRNLHGHSYEATVQIQANAGLDPQSMVIDFATVKSTIGKWIDDNFDHATILQKDDPLAKLPWSIFGEKGPYLTDMPPTAEVLAHLIYYNASALLNRYATMPVSVARVRLQETKKNAAYFWGG